MKILVTGGAGFIGSNLIKRLLKEGHEVHSLDNYSTGTTSNEYKGATYHTGDIGNVGLMDKDFNIIFHLAALSRIQPSFNNPSNTFDVNVTGTKEVLELARQYSIKVVYAGSSSIHYNPYQSPYATSKYLGEELCKMYKKTYNLNVEIARFYNVYGPGEILDGESAAVIGKFRYAVNSNLPLIIIGDGKQRRDFTHVDDIVDGLIKIGASKEIHDDGWELGTGINYSILEVASMFNHHVIYMQDQPGNYKETLNTSKDAIEKLKWKPKDKLKKYIKSL